jgi:hypothetical protein
MSHEPEPSTRGARQPLALAGLLAIGGLVVAGLLLVGNAYGFHRDELYFVVAGGHPDWGYVDQPPLTPLLSAAAVELLGLSPLAIRIVPAFAAATVAMLAGAIARDLGGSRRAQLLAAGLVAISAVLGLGHLASTTTLDILAWVAILWLVIRVLDGADPREWLGIGLVAGVGLQNKHLVLLLALGLVIGLVAARRWDVLRGRWTWLGVGVALLIWLPNLVWQINHGLPQLAMGAAIGERASFGDVLLIVPFQLILAGVLTWPVLLVGLWWLLRSAEGRSWRAIGWAYLAVLGITMLTRGQLYYPAGFLPVLLAAGCLPLDRWLSRGRPALRLGAFAAVAAASGAVMVLLMLPILPPRALAQTPIPGIYPETGEQIGWEELVEAVQGVVDELDDGQASRAAVLTSSYGEAGALDLLGGERMPPVYSGHNSYWSWGPPPDERDVVVLVGWWAPERFEAVIGHCDRRATIGNAAGIENEVAGAGVWVCAEPRGRWSEIWDELRTFS